MLAQVSFYYLLYLAKVIVIPVSTQPFTAGSTFLSAMPCTEDYAQAIA